MGKTGKWFRSLLSSKKNSPPAHPINKYRYVETHLNSPYIEVRDASKHAIAVAAATAAVAEAALAAAQAAAEVVRLTSGGGSVRNVRSVALYVSGDRRRVAAAALKIQSAFRAYLARRALRALKGLVKLQALVRGHIVRKQSANMLRRMQAMARIQARASANRTSTSDHSSNSKTQHLGVVSLRKYDSRSNSTKHGEPKLSHSRPRSCNIVNKESSQKPLNWLDQWMEQCKSSNPHNTSLDTPPGDDEKSDKILEIDTWKPHSLSRKVDRSFPTSQYIPPWNEMRHDYPKTSSNVQKLNPSISSEEISSVRDQFENSPGVHSASSQPILRGPFTPKRSECSRSLHGDYLSHPSYMANTESSKAKVRSLSAPKQRMQLEEHGLSSKFGQNIWESDAVSEKGSTIRGNYRSNSYLQQSGHLKRQGHPLHGSMYGHML